MATHRLLDAAAIQERMPLSIRTIRAWLSEDRLPTVRIGRRVFVDEATLDRWIEAKMRPAREDLAR